MLSARFVRLVPFVGVLLVWVVPATVAAQQTGTIRGVVRDATTLAPVPGAQVGVVGTIESPLRLSESPIAQGPIPALGPDTDAVLCDIGYSAAEIAELYARYERERRRHEHARVRRPSHPARASSPHAQITSNPPFLTRTGRSTSV